MNPPLLEVRDVTVGYPGRSGFWRRPDILKVVRGVSLHIAAGESLGIVGESGCGKSTLGRAVLGLIPPVEGTILWQGRPMAAQDKAAMRRLRSEIQVIFQDPLAALDPRMTVGQQVEEPLLTHRPGMPRAQRQEMVRAMLEHVGIRPDMMQRYPHEFSGGQAQRIAIARALILKPKLVVCDEPVSALDVSIQAQILNLLLRLRDEFQLSLLFISHDLAVVRRICERVAVLYLGKVMEEGPRETLFARPFHPYTRALLSAVPVPDPVRALSRRRILLHGDLPSPLSPPGGCVFRTRCPRAQPVCAQVEPKLQDGEAGHRFACHFPHMDAAEEADAVQE